MIGVIDMREHANIPRDSLVPEYSLVRMIKLCILSGKSPFNKVQSHAGLARVWR